MLDTHFFHTVLPDRPMGKYAHIVMLRVTEGYALFQTDGELNRARIAAGAQDATPMTRITLFKRKQTTPERLNGRELLRNVGLLSTSNDEKEELSCIYNVKSCKRCPDCIAYGFAVGTEAGSEKSKVYSDTAFSLTRYEDSHEPFMGNAPYEDGTMWGGKDNQTSTKLFEQDHVKPQVIFPSVITTRDLTASLFGYVLSNITRTTRYGATTTRGGTMRNHIAAIILSDGEIFSNLLFTQTLYDLLRPAGKDPVPVRAALDAAAAAIPMLLAADNARDHQTLMGADLETFLAGFRGMSEEDFREMLVQANVETNAYHDAHIAKPSKDGKAGKNKA